MIGPQPEFDGGCLCGAVRYRACGPVIAAAHCHCAMCRRAAGAPFVSFAAVPSDRFAWTAGTPKLYRSSASGWRYFCGDCGAQLAFQSSDRPESIEFTVATLDQPDSLVPTYHVWCMSRLPWIDIPASQPQLQANTAAAAETGFVIPRHVSWGEPE